MTVLSKSRQHGTSSQKYKQSKQRERGREREKIRNKEVAEEALTPDSKLKMGIEPQKTHDEEDLPNLSCKQGKRNKTHQTKNKKKRETKKNEEQQKAKSITSQKTKNLPFVYFKN
jgi:hypothetical protein